MRIVLIAGTIMPHISPRAFRTTELAVSLARLGHDVTVYKKKTNVNIRSLGPSEWGNLNSDGINNRGIVSKVLEKLLWRIIDFPKTEYFFKTIRVLKKEKNFDYLISIAQPFPIHWAAAYIREKYPNKFRFWTADCGDPFVCNPNIKRFKPLLAPIEKYWCNKVDKITVPVQGAVNGYYPEFRSKINIIPQGIDFRSIVLDEYHKNFVPTFLFSGVVITERRDPTKFLNYLQSISNKDFLFVVYSKSAIFSQYKEKLGNHLVIRDYIPRVELIKIQSTMDFLINIQNSNPVQVPSKLIDYSLTQRPILNISSQFTHEEQIAFEEFMTGNYSKQYVVDNISQYDSDNVARQFISLTSEK